MYVGFREVPHATQPRRVKKFLQLRCDECKVEFERRWLASEVFLEKHMCSRTCVNASKRHDAAIKEKISRSTKVAMSRPDVRARLMESIEKRKNDPIYREKLLFGIKRSFLENPERRTKSSEAMKLVMADPVFKERFLRSQNTEKLKQFRREAALNRWQNPTNRTKLSEQLKASWADPESRHGNPTWIAKQSHAQRAVWEDPAYRESRSGCNNPMSGRINSWWQPWMTENLDINKWASAVKAMCGHRCMMCDAEERLDAHHIVPKSICQELRLDLNNGIALCERCHDGAGNQHSAHALLRRDVDSYRSVMQKLLHKRDLLVT